MSADTERNSVSLQQLGFLLKDVPTRREPSN